MDNKTIARILRDTAQLLEIDGAIIGRYRSYEKAAELISGMHESIEELAKDPDKLEELPGIGERMAEPTVAGPIRTIAPAAGISERREHAHFQQSFSHCWHNWGLIRVRTRRHIKTLGCMRL